MLDATIVKPLIESVTGEDLITGEDLSDFEREMKIVSGVVSLFTLGQGGVVISSGRVVMQSTLVTMGKMVAIDMVTTGVTYGTSEMCQKMGLPSLLAILRASGAGNALYREEMACVFSLSMTSMILLRSGQLTSTRYLISPAQSIAVRCAHTLTWRMPPRGSTNVKMLQVPFRIYSESTSRVSSSRHFCEV